MSRNLKTTALIAATAALLAGCGGESHGSASAVRSGQVTTITLVSYLPVISAPAGALLNHEIASFEASHPGVRVQLQAAAAPTGPAVASTVQQDEAAGTTPDVVQAGLDSLRFLAHGGLGAQDLGQIIGERGLASEWGGDHPYPAAIRALGQVSGQQYGIPWVLSTPVLFYNASLFQRAGLNPHRPPATWSELAADALKIKHSTGADGLANCGAGASSGEVDWCTQAIIDSAGGSVLSSDGQQVTFDDAGAASAMAEMQALGRSGAMVNVTTKQSVQEFAQGKLAMIVQSSAAQALLLTSAAGHFKVLDGPLPAFGTHPAVPTNSGSALTIFSKSAAKRAAAWALVKYLTTDSAYTAITEKIGYAPLRVSLISDPRYLAHWAKAEPLIAVNMRQLDHVAPWQDYPGPNYAQIEGLLESAVANIAFDGADPRHALSGAQSQASGLIQ